MRPTEAHKAAQGQTSFMIIVTECADTIVSMLLRMSKGALQFQDAHPVAGKKVVSFNSLPNYKERQVRKSLC